ncbi:MAG: hypothetical protein KJ069_18430 [Anaerolineae bacterium]|nr:hypothetical protein [Anaerolineae bacterium]
MAHKQTEQAKLRRRLLRRQRFAKHIEYEIDRLNTLEEWRDYRFAELEAEVEAEGRHRSGFLRRRTRTGLRRERSLTKALENSAEQLVLVEGEPGSGKSVALRHVALNMARAARESENVDSIVPIYINLKELAREQIDVQQQPTDKELQQLYQVLLSHYDDSEIRSLCFLLNIEYELLPPGNRADKARGLIEHCRRHGRSKELLLACRNDRLNLDWSWITTIYSGAQIDANLIKGFVLKSLNRANDRDIEEYLEEEFELGLEKGTWFFLFDSFDELPDILSSTEADDIIRSYSDAISDFLHGLNNGRGVIASRHFRGPRQSRWARFRILPLSEERRLELIQKADLKVEIEQELIGQLGNASQEIQQMSKNPLFLGLLCEHMRDGHPFPTNTHTVFETYVTNRLTRDEIRLQKRFQLAPQEVRIAAENIAFTMAADSGLGLSPTRDNLKAGLDEQNLNLGDRYETILDALEYIKLARSETATSGGESKSFTFAHRRFQEYFATCVVLRYPDRVTPQQLLTDARWRETAVTIFQTQTAATVNPLLEIVDQKLDDLIQRTEKIIEDPSQFVNKLEDEEPDQPLPEPFRWTPGAHYLFSLLQDGFQARYGELPGQIRNKTSQYLLTASYYGTLYDKKSALEVAATTNEDVLRYLIRQAFTTNSTWLGDIAYRQTAQLSELPDDIARSIRLALLKLFGSGRLRREEISTKAHLNRLSRADEFLSAFTLLLLVRPIDLMIHASLSIYLLFLLNSSCYLKGHG